MSNKNLLCLILTFGLAFLTIGSAFHSGNVIFGTETILIWLIVYLIMPMAILAQRKAECSVCVVNMKRVFQNTIDNKYIFTSFCAALFLSIVFDDYLGYVGGFVDSNEIMDLFFISMITFVSAAISVAMYYLVCKARIHNLKKFGERVEVVVTSVKKLHETYYVLAYATNPITGNKLRVVGVTYADSKDEIPKWLNVYFDKVNKDEYFFDTCSWIIEY